MPEHSAASLVEAHSYAGGLRHTPFCPDGPRPDWAPPADSVGWRDEFELEAADTVIEFSQRQHDGDVVTWLAVYKRSVDARFGDRNNHAGVGVWLSRNRIADARALLLSLDGFAVTLAANPDPSLLTEKIADFASNRRFLQSYLVPADSLPPDWGGAPPSSSALADTSLFAAVAPNFNAALVPIAEAVTRWSLGWDNSGMTPRALVRVTNDPVAPSRPGFTELPPSGTFLADVIDRIPQSFASAREAVRVAEAKRVEDISRLESEVQSLKEKWDQERRESELLDGLPATMGGIAKRLNNLSRQYSDLRAQISKLSPQAHSDRSAGFERAQPISQVHFGGNDRDYYSKTTQRPRSRAPSYYRDDGEAGGMGDYVGWTVFGAAILAVVGIIIYTLYRG
ncbi:MAG: hypothetical protein QOH81_2344 [Sphingomonadales bacterium]|jgi:hypothetical protein|nr:hypothetical protein [Sphingomonadales bacterium]